MGGLEVDKAQFDAWLVEKNNDYLTYINKMDESEILPDVHKVLDYLREREVPMALGSASKNAVPILDLVGVLSYFKTVVDGKAVSRAKPDPEVFLIAADAMGVSASHCVVFEDAVAGIEAANVAGMVSIGIGDPDVLDNAMYNFRDFTQIRVEFLDQLMENTEVRN
jgi:beta-phosphoglucomutase